MANYILVQGGDKRDGSVWENVVQLLISNNHNVFYLSMRPLKEGATLQENSEEIHEIIQSKNLDDVILVGHSYSYGGVVITGVADRLYDKVPCMVYIDSVVPKDGKSLFGLFADNGFDYKKVGLPPNKGCFDVLNFNEEVIKMKPKAYIHCVQSIFAMFTKSIYINEVVDRAQADSWSYFALDIAHDCMLTRPKEVAIILEGVQVIAEK